MALKFYKDSVKGFPAEVKKELGEIEGKPAERFLRLALNLPRLRRPTTQKIIDTIKATNAEFKVSPDFPLAIPSKLDAKAVMVFPNIKANFQAKDVLEYILNLLKDPKTQLRLSTPERAAKLALKREKTTLAKLLSDYTNIKELGYKDDTVREVAEKVVCAFQPTKIVMCKTPKDYFDMYGVKVGYSCMAHGSTYFGDWTSKTWMEVANDTGIYPSSWYHYLPHARGGMLMAGGKPVVRFMLYRTDLTKDEWPFYGDIKYETTAYKNELETLLKAQGKKPMAGRATTLSDFRVPGVFHKALWEGKVAGCPLPFHDNQADDYSFAYDSEKAEFVFGPSKQHPKWTAVGYHYNWKGFIKADEIAQFKEDNPVEEKPVEVKEPEPVEEVLVKKPKRVYKRKVAEEVELVKPVEDKKSNKIIEKPAEMIEGWGDYLVTIG